MRLLRARQSEARSMARLSARRTCTLSKGAISQLAMKAPMVALGERVTYGRHAALRSIQR
jgi:hypothetical protein